MLLCALRPGQMTLTFQSLCDYLIESFQWICVDSSFRDRGVCGHSDPQQRVCCYFYSTLQTVTGLDSAPNTKKWEQLLEIRDRDPQKYRTFNKYLCGTRENTGSNSTCLVSRIGGWIPCIIYHIWWSLSTTTVISEHRTRKRFWALPDVHPLLPKMPMFGARWSVQY